ncbi:MAG: sensor histidine kinase [Actinomycetes bacterium]
MRSLRLRLAPLAIDIALAVAFTALAQVELRISADDGYKAGPLWLNTLLEALATVPLALRSVRPRLALGLMCAAMAVPSLVVGHTLLFWGNFLPLMLVNYTVARSQNDWLGRWTWAVCTATTMTFALHIAELRTWDAPLFPLVMFGASWAAGLVVHRLSEQRTALAVALAELASGQALREEAAVDAERRRIAAEMHDVVAHAVSLMTVQVGAARLQLESQGVPVPGQRQAAEETGRQATTELRRTLGVLRERPETGPLEPLPDLGQLPALLPRFREAGLPVTLHVAGAEELPPSVQLAAYRIVQEALTNVVKHADRASTDVTITGGPGQLAVRVRNAPVATHRPRALGASSGGHGLAGLRERVTMFGGSLRAAPTSDGGFEVLATLPVQEPSAVRSLAIPTAPVPTASIQTAPVPTAPVSTAPA